MIIGKVNKKPETYLYCGYHNKQEWGSNMCTWLHCMFTKQKPSAIFIHTHTNTYYSSQTLAEHRLESETQFTNKLFQHATLYNTNISGVKWPTVAQQ